MTNQMRIAVAMPTWALRRWWEVAYLYPVPLLAEKWRELIMFEPDEKFENVIGEHVSALVQDGVMPPEAIAPVIMNLADDMMAGRKMTIRAGDYIQLQGFLRGMK